MSVDELMEVKGGVLDNNKLCSLTGAGFKCTAEGSGICTVEGSGIIVKDPGPIPADPGS